MIHRRFVARLALCVVLAACAKSEPFVSPADTGGGAWVFNVRHLGGGQDATVPRGGDATPMVVLGTPLDGAAPEEVAAAMRMPAKFGGGGFRLVSPADPNAHLAVAFGAVSPASLCGGAVTAASSNPEMSAAWCVSGQALAHVQARGGGLRGPSVPTFERSTRAVLREMLRTRRQGASR